MTWGGSFSLWVLSTNELLSKKHKNCPVCWAHIQPDTGSIYWFLWLSSCASIHLFKKIKKRNENAWAGEHNKVWIHHVSCCWKQSQQCCGIAWDAFTPHHITDTFFFFLQASKQIKKNLNEYQSSLKGSDLTFTQPIVIGFVQAQQQR